MILINLHVKNAEDLVYGRIKYTCKECKKTAWSFR
jgi:hypothetical protein